MKLMNLASATACLLFAKGADLGAAGLQDT